MEETLINKHNHACIFTQCKLPYNKTMLRGGGLKRDPMLGKKGSKYTRNQTTFTESQLLRFFCRDDNPLEQLHEPGTVDDNSMNDHVRKYAVLLGDTHLLAKLSSCDLVAQEG